VADDVGKKVGVDKSAPQKISHPWLITCVKLLNRPAILRTSVGCCEGSSLLPRRPRPLSLCRLLV
jgi:hypothetical protein